MKSTLSILTLAGAITLSSSPCPAQTNSAPAAAPDAADKQLAAANKHAKPILDSLKLTDAAKETKVHDILVAQFEALRSWHAKNDPQINDLWNQFNKARAKLDQPKADETIGQIDAVYAGFKPQHDQFVSELARQLSPEQVEQVKDLLTVYKVKVTYGVYLQIFPGLKDDEKAVVLKNLKAAREEAIDCEAMKEKSAFFKKYKIKIEEGYLTAQGYNPKQARQEFDAKQKADMAAKKGTAAAPAQDDKE